MWTKTRRFGGHSNGQQLEARSAGFRLLRPHLQ
jgi:hypothetical protein